MKRMLLLTPIALGGAFVARYLMTSDQRDRLSQLPATLMKRCMEQMPDDFPPKVMTSGVRQIQSQNEEILALLREQQELRRRPPAARARRVRRPTRETPAAE